MKQKKGEKQKEISSYLDGILNSGSKQKPVTTTPNIFRQVNHMIDPQQTQNQDINMSTNDKNLEWIRGYMECTNISATKNIIGNFCKNIQRMSGSDAVSAESVRQLVATGSLNVYVCYMLYVVFQPDPTKEFLIPTSLPLYIKT